jgi:hypothetical protein
MHVQATKKFVLRREGPFDEARGRLKIFEQGVIENFLARDRLRLFFASRGPEFFVKVACRNLI